ncbi:hypothetical protein E2C01_096002 [Portunus trituberculatus]|uniref:Uncharacterized protein n=1 Tax=Portunus trituberculatus TaxID=210409 RepID=A0A5B7K1W7_PORTR|nr:hypothetical protein [Portunus trituberculatus]
MVCVSTVQDSPVTGGLVEMVRQWWWKLRLVLEVVVLMVEVVTRLACHRRRWRRCIRCCRRRFLLFHSGRGVTLNARSPGGENQWEQSTVTALLSQH